MKNKKSEAVGNYLDRIPARLDSIQWRTDEEGKVTLQIENTGWANYLAQLLFKRPRYSYIHLDEMGSFLWPLLDGEQDLTALGKLVEERFGEAAHPLYERLAEYFRILDSYHFIKWVK
ncbi:MAG: PqqD family protein [Clostridia bacterium]|nr:PqqD family protein [Clostridia bacterium]